MTSWLVRVEGVNFDSTVFDTNDLSTVRGGSLALLRLGDAVEKALAAIGAVNRRCIYAGASQCAFIFDLPDDEGMVADHVRRQVLRVVGSMPGGPDQPPLAQTTTVIDVVRTGIGDVAENEALKHAEARNHTQQFRGWTIAPLAFDPRQGQADPFDLVRPASETRLLPPGKVLDPDEDAEGAAPPNTAHGRLARSVARRRDYGRRARQQFYFDELDGQAIPEGAGEILQFPEARVLLANSFQDIVDRGDPPVHVGTDRPLRTLPPALENKIAVVYADGNGFSRIREEHSVGVARFNKEITPLRKRLLAAVLRWYMSGIHSSMRDAFAVDEASHYGARRLGLRFETLLWGGDELIFVMPAWLVFGFLSGFFAETAHWKIRDWSLTHAVGVTIAHCKTPIRQLKAIAAEAANAAKEAGLRGANSVTFEIFESLAPPDTGLGGYREAIFGGADHKPLARWLALPGTEFGEFERRMWVLKGVDSDDIEAGFPRSQLYDALRAVRGKLTNETGVKAVVEHLAVYRRRAGGAAKAALLEDHLPPDWDETESNPRPLPMALYLISQLWDYARPFATPLPDFPAARRGVS